MFSLPFTEMGLDCQISNLGYCNEGGISFAKVGTVGVFQSNGKRRTLAKWNNTNTR